GEAADHRQLIPHRSRSIALHHDAIHTRDARARRADFEAMFAVRHADGLDRVADGCSPGIDELGGAAVDADLDATAIGPLLVPELETRHLLTDPARRLLRHGLKPAQGFAACGARDAGVAVAH